MTPQPLTTLKEAFPNLDEDVIDDVLVSTHNDMDAAFDVLLTLSSDQPSQRPPTPPRPCPTTCSSSTTASSNRRHLRTRSSECTNPFINNNTTTSRIQCYRPTVTNDLTNPFLQATKQECRNARQELAQWRQELAQASRRRHSDHRRPRPSTSSISLNSQYSSMVPQEWRYWKNATSSLYQKLASSTVRVDMPATRTDPSSRISGPNSLAPPPPHTLRPTSSDSALPTQGQDSRQQQQQQQQQRETPAPQLPPRGDRNRPLPPIPRVPVPSADAVPGRAGSTNPFDQNGSNDEEDVPPPAYETHQFDAYVDPQDADRVIQEHQQRQLFSASSSS